MPVLTSSLHTTCSLSAWEHTGWAAAEPTAWGQHNHSSPHPPKGPDVQLLSTLALAHPGFILPLVAGDKALQTQPTVPQCTPHDSQCSQSFCTPQPTGPYTSLQGSEGPEELAIEVLALISERKNVLWWRFRECLGPPWGVVGGGTCLGSGLSQSLSLAFDPS